MMNNNKNLLRYTGNKSMKSFIASDGYPYLFGRSQQLKDNWVYIEHCEELINTGEFVTIGEFKLVETEDTKDNNYE